MFLVFFLIAAVSGGFLGGCLRSALRWYKERQPLPVDAEDLNRLRRRDVHASDAIILALLWGFSMYVLLLLVIGGWALPRV